MQRCFQIFCKKLHNTLEKKLEKHTGLRKVAWETKIQDTDSKDIFSWKCHAGENSIFIDHRGNAFLCGIYRNDPISIISNSIEDVLAHLQKIHRRHKEIVFSNECAACKMRKICKWCPAYACLYNGNEYEKVDFFCKLSQARTDAFGTTFSSSRS